MNQRRTTFLINNYFENGEPVLFSCSSFPDINNVQEDRLFSLVKNNNVDPDLNYVSGLSVIVNQFYKSKMDSLIQIQF